jgi:hypothetical protein
VLELDCHLLRLRVDEVDNSLQRRNMGVRPDARILGCVAALDHELIQVYRSVESDPTLAVTAVASKWIKALPLMAHCP